MTNKVIRATPDTNVLAKVYQLYIVLYQCASMLISHNHGIVDITVSANTNRYDADQTVFVHWNFFPSSTLIFPASVLKDKFLIFLPSKDQSVIVSTVQMVKNVLFKKGDFCFKISSSWSSGAAQ